jgi:hypothetical protein
MPQARVLCCTNCVDAIQKARQTSTGHSHLLSPTPPTPPPPPRFERKGFKLVALKLYQTPKEVAEEHYKDLASKPFYTKLVEYIVSGPVVAMVSRFWDMAALL